ncbi:MAG: amidohydrolase, partial [Chitinophagaceae bacterium]
RSSVQDFLPRFKRNQVVLLVHNVETDLADLSYIKKQTESGIDCWLCLCPNANHYINGRLPDLELINENYDQIVLGTDSLASNDQLSIMEEIKTIHHAAPSIPVSKLLQWATLNGAKVLDIAEETGSFEKGKQPGIVLLRGVTKDTIMDTAASERLL